MNKLNKALTAIIIIFIIINLFCNSTYATIGKNDIENALSKYASGEKTATTTTDTGTVTIGKDEGVIESYSVTEDTITIDGYVFNYSYSAEDNSISIYSTVSISYSDSSYKDKLIPPFFFPTLFISIADIYGIDSNKSLSYYCKVNPTKETSRVPSSVDTNNGISYMKWLSNTDAFASVYDPIFNSYKTIINNSTEEFAYTDNLKIYLSNLEQIKDIIPDEPEYPEEQYNPLPESGSGNILLILLFAVICIGIKFYIKYNKIDK